MIVNKTFERLKTSYQKELIHLTITDVRVGVHLSAVKLSDNSFGVASTVEDSELFCPKKDRDYGDFTPTKIKGKKVTELFESKKQSGLIRTIKVAVLNAISSNIIDKSNYTLYNNTDPYDLLDLSKPKTVTIVGAFQSYIKKFAKTNHKLYVLELNENALNEDQKEYYVPAEDYQKVITISDIVIITGLTIVNNTIEGLLSVIANSTEVVVTGPSSSMVPDLLFESNVKYIGAVRVTDGDRLFEVVGQGGHGYHLFKYCAEKICIVNEKQ